VLALACVVLSLPIELLAPPLACCKHLVHGDWRRDTNSLGRGVR
jgi:hypothetical protein